MTLSIINNVTYKQQPDDRAKAKAAVVDATKESSGLFSTVKLLEHGEINTLTKLAVNKIANKPNKPQPAQIIELLTQESATFPLSTISIKTAITTKYPNTNIVIQEVTLDEKSKKSMRIFIIKGEINLALKTNIHAIEPELLPENEARELQDKYKLHGGMRRANQQQVPNTNELMRNAPLFIENFENIAEFDPNEELSEEDSDGWNLREGIISIPSSNLPYGLQAKASRQATDFWNELNRLADQNQQCLYTYDYILWHYRNQQLIATLLFEGEFNNFPALIKTIAMSIDKLTDKFVQRSILLFVCTGVFIPDSAISDAFGASLSRIADTNQLNDYPPKDLKTISNSVELGRFGNHWGNIETITDKIGELLNDLEE